MKADEPSPLSKASFLPHWDGAVYTKYASMWYDLVTKLTGWRSQLSKSALSGLPSSGSILDIGCGTGFLLHNAQELGYSVTGLDPSRGMLDKAVSNYGFIIGKELLFSTADKIPLSDASQDIIICSGSLVHIPELADVVIEIKRVLKKGGWLRIIDHAKPVDISIMTPFVTLFSQGSGDVLHDYKNYFSSGFDLHSRKTLGRGGYLQCFDFIKK